MIDVLYIDHMGSELTVVNGTGKGTTNANSEATGGGAIQLGRGLERPDDPPRINLTDEVYKTLYITAGSSETVGADDVLANMKLKDLSVTGTFDLNESPLVRIYADGSNAVRIQTPTAAGLIVEQHLWAKDIVTDDDITTSSYVNCDGVKVGGTQVVGTQCAIGAGPPYPLGDTSGSDNDGTCRAAVNTLINAVQDIRNCIRSHGLMA